MRTHRSGMLLLVFQGLLLTACQQDPGTGVETNFPEAVPLAVRNAPTDTSRLIARFRERGSGPVFVQLTGEPRDGELRTFEKLGMRGPGGSSRVVHFDSLEIRTVWGHVTARQVRQIAELP